MRLLSILLALVILVSGCIYTPQKVSQHTSRVVSTLSNSVEPKENGQVIEWNGSVIVLPSKDASFNCSGVLWRYFLMDALQCILNKEELTRISPLASALKGRVLEDSVWNVLTWEEKWISYDRAKAKLPALKIVVYPNGTGVVVRGKNSTIQTPYETIVRRKGVCTDYTILTDALLLAMNYSPVYAMIINFTKPPGHAVALVKVEGWYFALDQHLPPMDLASYYRYWKKRGRTITNATLYRITLNNGKVRVIPLGIFLEVDFLRQDYTISREDVEELARTIMRLMHERFGVSLDENLAQGKTVLGGHVEVRYFRFYGFADYYHPLFLKDYSLWLLEKMGREMSAALSSAKELWVEASVKDSDLVVVVYIGS